MSEESMQHLNTKVLVGFKNKRGHAWHYREDMQGDENNHYDDAVPVDDALRRVFNFTGDPQPVFTLNSAGEVFQIDDMLAIVKSDENRCLGVHSSGYKPHQYKEWLIDNVAKLIDGHTGIGTIGVLRNGAQAWVQIETPETFKTTQGVDFRSFVLATTSFDGSIATLYKMCNQLTVCDNTRNRALSEDGLSYKVKHTANSHLKLDDARAALHMIEREQEAFAQEIETLCNWKVTEKQFQDFLAKLVPLPEIKEKDVNARDYSTRNATIARKRREELNALYRSDGRVEPWKGTAFGVLQMVNTFNHHENKLHKNAESRYLRNMSQTIEGEMAKRDAQALKFLELVCA